MTRPFLRRFSVGLLLAVPLAALSFAIAQGYAGTPLGPLPQSTCVTCHYEIYDAWDHGAHGQAAENEAFLADWKAKGEPKECKACHTTGYDPETDTSVAEGVACLACHGPAPASHPGEPMPVTRTSEACSECHQETYFAWQASVHGTEDIACSTCHDPHGTALKAENGSMLCASCHGTRAASFAHSEHQAQGLTCLDCHLKETDIAPAGGHAQRDHTFSVDLATCTDCHAYQLHAAAQPSEAEPVIEAAENLDAMSAVEGAQISEDPGAVSPMVFATLSGLIGMATGMILAPWLERWYQRIRSEDE
jgi:predicted CXXCH cytochrome family protein